MASFSQPPLFSSVAPINKKKPPVASLSSQQPKKNPPGFKISKISSSNSEPSPSKENSPEDPVKLAFAKAKAYKNSKQSSTPTPDSVPSPLHKVKPYDKVTGISDGGPLPVKLAFGNKEEYNKRSRSLAETKSDFSKIVENLGTDSAAEMDEKNYGLQSDKDDDGGQKEVPLAIKLAFEKAKEYKKNKDVVGVDGTLASGLKGGSVDKNPRNDQSIESCGKKDGLTISSIDFMGLAFSDKKSIRGLPAGLVPRSGPFLEGELPEVEILIGDMSKFNDASKASKPIPVNENDDDAFKPKVSTWGLLPRPSNIPETYMVAEEVNALGRHLKQQQKRELPKSKIGLNIDPKLKSENEKAAGGFSEEV
ncbi:hypothetical protein OROMI_014555 [Orobanche minor]